MRIYDSMTGLSTNVHQDVKSDYRLDPPDAARCPECRTSMDRDGHEWCDYHEKCGACCGDEHCEDCWSLLDDEGNCSVCEMFSNDDDLPNAPIVWLSKVGNVQPGRYHDDDRPAFYYPGGHIGSWRPVPDLFEYSNEVHCWIGRKAKREARLRKDRQQWVCECLTDGGNEYQMFRASYADDAFSEAARWLDKGVDNVES